jgi:hypothetical protein
MRPLTQGEGLRLFGLNSLDPPIRVFRYARRVVSRAKFWVVCLSLFGIACAISWVARQRTIELAEVRASTQGVEAKTAADLRLCATERTQAEARAADVAKHVKEAETRESATRQQLAAWQSVGTRAGIIAWLGTHANCVGRGSDGRCTKYKLPEGAVIETEAQSGAPAATRAP